MGVGKLPENVQPMRKNVLWKFGRKNSLAHENHAFFVLRFNASPRQRDKVHNLFSAEQYVWPEVIWQRKKWLGMGLQCGKANK
jgi:hypothetical protein